jgi:hypothetical protein
VSPQSPNDQHPLESLSSIERRKFLGLAAFASASVIGVGVASSAAPAPAEAAEADTAPQPAPPPPYTIDRDTGWPIFEGSAPPAGYVRHHLPCDQNEYVDVPDNVSKPAGGVTIVEPPYQHADWHRVSGGQE